MMPNGTLTSIIQATGVKPGAKWVQELQDITDALELRIVHELRDVSGSNAVTATAHPDITQLAGQTFWFVASMTNTGAMTLQVGAHGALPLRTRSGAELQSGQCAAGYAYLIQHVADAADPHYRFLVPLVTATTPIVRVYDVAGSYTWSKPDGLAYVEVELIGGGGRGSSYYLSSYVRRDGGSGAYARGIVPADSLAMTETVIVGAGGTAGSVDGGDSSFGSHVVAGGGPSSPAGAYAVATAGDVLIPGAPVVERQSVEEQPMMAPPMSSPQFNNGTGGGPGAGGAGHSGNMAYNYDGNDGIVIVREYY